MSAFGKFSELTFVNDLVPPINDTNLNELQRVVALSDQELARSQNYRFRQIKEYCWNLNCKIIHLFNDTSDWAASGSCTISYANYPRSGDTDVAMVENDNAASTIGIYDTLPSTLDLELFNDGETVSTTDNIISLSTYLSDLAKFDSITVKLGDDASNYYYKQFTISGSGSDRVVFSAKKSDFSTTGSPSSWAGIDYVAIEAVTQANAINEYIILHLLCMYRNDPVNDGYPQPLQWYKGASTGWENIFEQETPNWLMYVDTNINDIGIQKFDDMNDTDNFDTLHVHCNVIDFLWESLLYCKLIEQTNSMCWYVDSNNYAVIYYEVYEFYLTVVEAGVATTQTSYISEDLNIDMLLTLKLEKHGDTIRGSVLRGNSYQVFLEHETSISSDSDGCLYFGHPDVGNSYIVDWKVSNVNDISIDNWERPKLVIKLEDESTDTDVSPSDDSELFAELPPNSMFEIEANIRAIADSATPDIRVDWAVYGDAEFITVRQAIGPPTSMTTVFDTTVIFTDGDENTDIPYGLRSAYESIIWEKFIVKTGVLGGKISLRWAQQTSDSDEITVKADSYLKITKLEQLQQNKNV